MFSLWYRVTRTSNISFPIFLIFILQWYFFLSEMSCWWLGIFKMLPIHAPGNIFWNLVFWHLEICFHSINFPTWLNCWNVCDFCFHNPHVYLIGLVFIVVWRKTCNFCINDPSTSIVLCKLKYTLIIYICCISDTDGFLSLVGVIKINNSL